MAAGVGMEVELGSPASAGASPAAKAEGGGDGGDEAAKPGPKELPPLKVAFYELLVRQLQDDGFASEAQSIAQRLHLEPNLRADRDALFESYGKSMKWAFGDDRRGEWTKLECLPVPPLGPQERILDFERVGEKRKCPASGNEQQPGSSGGAAAASGAAASGGRRAPPEVRLLYTATHRKAVRAVAYSADGRTCATGCLDGTIKILDCGKMRACAVSSEGTLGRMRVTDEELSKPIVRTLQDHLLGVTCVAFHPTNPTLFSGSSDKAVKIFDLTRPPGHKKAFSVLQDVYAVRCLSIHPCGDFLFVGTDHQAARLYDLQTLRCFTAFDQTQHHGGAVNDMRCSSDGRVFASASSDGSISFWDAVSFRLINRVPKAHSGTAVTSLRWSRNQRYLVSGGCDGRSRLWDMRNGQELFSMGFGQPSCEFNSAVLASGERYCASASSNSRMSDIGLFEAFTGTTIFMKLGLHPSGVRALEASPVDNSLISGCDDHNARFFSIEEKGAGS